MRPFKKGTAPKKPIILRLEELVKIFNDNLSPSVGLTIENEPSMTFPDYLAFTDPIMSKCKHVKLTIDTAHLFGSGILIEDFLAMNLSPDKLMFHLNGSSDEFNSGGDKHQRLCSKADLIFHNKQDVLCQLLCQYHSCLFILERRAIGTDWTS